ncbi:MAG TPA: metallophosphoesterase [Opitutaceae bacterium]
MAAPLTRILSDLHFGDRGTRVSDLAQLRPLLDGADHLILNGDSLDTRPGPAPQHTAECAAAIRDFFPRHVPRVTYHTGNHDADFSSDHTLDLAGGAVWVTHGDIFFPTIVPWSIDGPLVARLVAEELRTLPCDPFADLAEHLALFRRVALRIPQRHQSERNPVKYLASLLYETVWPPLRVFRIFAAWREAPRAAAMLARRHRPRARFVIAGHTHRAGIWPVRPGIVYINTGSFCQRLLGATAVDVTAESLVVREVTLRGGEFRFGARVAEFPLAVG